MYRPSASEEEIAKWRGIVAEGETKEGCRKEWLTSNGISTWQYYCWRKRFRQEDGLEDPPAVTGDNQPEFYEMNLHSGNAHVSGHQKQGFEPSLMLQIDRYQLFVGDGITERTLGTVLKVLSNA